MQTGMTAYDLLKYLIEFHPAIAGVGSLGVIGFVFSAGSTWTNLRYMRRHMVTRKDLTIALDKTVDDKELVTKDTLETAIASGSVSNRLAYQEAMLAFAQSISKTYVTRRECEIMHETKPANGKGNRFV